MIQFSSVAATSPDILSKTANAAAPDGVFAGLLIEGLGEAAATGGKILPASGKDLPAGLPGEAAAAAPVAAVVASASPEIRQPLLVSAPATAAELPKAGETSDDTKIEQGAAEPADTASTDALPLILAVPLPLEKALAPVEAAQAEPAALPKTAPLPEQADPATAAKPAAEAVAAAPQEPARPRPVVVLPSMALAALAKTAEPAAKAGETAAKGPETASTSTQPSAQPAGQALPARAQPVGEIKLALGGERQPGNTDTAAARSAPLAQPVAAFDAPAVPIVSADTPSAVTNAKAAFDPAAQVRPQDLTQLVDRLVEARENARAGTAALTVMHAEFGEISLRFGQENGNLTVSLGNNDPGFVRAVNAAVATDAQAGGDMQFQGERQGGGQNASSRTGDAQASLTDRGGGNGRERDAQGGRSDRADTRPQAEARTARRALGGIFA